MITVPDNTEVPVKPLFVRQVKKISSNRGKDLLLWKVYKNRDAFYDSRFCFGSENI